MNWLNASVAGTLVLGAFLTLLPGEHLRSVKVADAATPSCGDISGLTLGALDQYAHDVVRQLTAGPGPCWMGKDWQTKAGLRLEGAEKTTSAQSHDVALENESWQRLLSDLRSPAQVVARKHSKDENFGDDVPDPRLTSIDYNPLAANAILKLKLDGPRGQGIAALPAGSVIVKTIWERADLSRSSCINLPASEFAAAAVATPGSPVSGQRAEQQGKPGVKDHLTKPFTSLLDTGWRWVGVSVDGTAQLCKPGSSAVPVQPVSTVYHKILPNDPFVLGYTRAGDLQGAGCHGPCLLAMLGVNLMVKAREGTDWVWIAMWWTGANHGYPGMDQNSPWQYYEIAFSDKGRDPEPGSPTVSPNPNNLFNPFLEGTQLHGAVANCKTCHQYAAVNPTDRATSLRDCGTGATLGGPPFPALSPGDRVQQAATCGTFYNPGRDPQDVHSFLNRYLTTDSLWSLTDATKEAKRKGRAVAPAGNDEL